MRHLFVAVLAAALLSVDGPFDPDQRRRVGKALECPALTFWGMPETGPVFAAHRSHVGGQGSEEA